MIHQDHTVQDSPPGVGLPKGPLVSEASPATQTPPDPESTRFAVPTNGHTVQDSPPELGLPQGLIV